MTHVTKEKQKPENVPKIHDFASLVSQLLALADFSIIGFISRLTHNEGERATE